MLSIGMAKLKTIQDIIAQRYSRRDVLRGSAKVTSTALVSTALSACTTTELIVHNMKDRVGPSNKQHLNISSLRFQEIFKGMDNDHRLAKGYDAQRLLSWGDPLIGNASAFNPKTQTANKQAAQFGFNNDFTMFFPLEKGEAASTHGLLCVNHEYVIPKLMHPGLNAGNAKTSSTQEQLRIEQEAVGCSVVEIVKDSNGWRTVLGKYNRRVTATTPITISGPAAGHPRLQTTADPSGRLVLGTFANCAGGITPWGTYLSCEENIDGFFTPPKSENPEARNHDRFTIGKPQYTSWNRMDMRFDSNKEPNEPNRFGWVVEIDPYQPNSHPVKRTALGRFKHESAGTYVNPDGRVVVYSGDDAKFEYIYRFISHGTISSNREANKTLLDNGTLSVAKFHSDGRLQWIPLLFGTRGLTPENGFYSQADVLIETRRAGDIVEATPMDRPEDVEVNSQSGKLYIVLTKNNARTGSQADAANPRAGNIHGHIIEVSAEVNGRIDHAASTVQWEMFLMGGNPSEPTDFALYHGPVSQEGWLSCPDNMAFDPQGRMWITTDGQPNSVGYADGLFACDTQGAGRGVTRHFFRGPKGCEVTGPSFTPDGRTLFLAVQHPGDTTGATLDKPSTRWPQFRKDMPARPSVLAITKKDGGVVGS